MTPIPTRIADPIKDSMDFPFEISHDPSFDPDHPYDDQPDDVDKNTHSYEGKHDPELPWGFGHRGNGSNFDLDDLPTWADEEEPSGGGWMPSTTTTIVVALLLICLLLNARRIQQAMKRRAASAAVRFAALRGDGDSELTPVNTWFGSSAPMRVLVTLNGRTHTIGAETGELISVNQLPFVLSDACAESEQPELVDLDVVDLLIKKKAELTYESKRGARSPLTGTTTVSDLLAAKSFHLHVLVDVAAEPPSRVPPPAPRPGNGPSESAAVSAAAAAVVAATAPTPAPAPAPSPAPAAPSAPLNTPAAADEASPSRGESSPDRAPAQPTSLAQTSGGAGAGGEEKWL